MLKNDKCDIIMGLYDYGSVCDELGVRMCLKKKSINTHLKVVFVYKELVACEDSCTDKRGSSRFLDVFKAGDLQN